MQVQMHKLLSLLLLSTALFATVAQAAPAKKVEILYELMHNGGAAVAEVSVRLEHDGKTYRLQENWKGKGVYALRGEAKRMSRGSIGPDGLRPEEFEEERPRRDPRRGKPEAKGQDRLSIFWHFAFAPPTRTATIMVYDGKGQSKHVYEPAGRERVKTPAGEFNAIKLVRKDDDKIAEVWLAQEKGNVPVRVVVTEKDGTRMEMVAARIVP
jgi:hypothetical protein